MKLIHTNISGKKPLLRIPTKQVSPFPTNRELGWLVKNNNKRTNIHKINHKIHNQGIDIQK